MFTDKWPLLSIGLVINCLMHEIHVTLVIWPMHGTTCILYMNDRLCMVAANVLLVAFPTLVKIKLFKSLWLDTHISSVWLNISQKDIQMSFSYKKSEATFWSSRFAARKMNHRASKVISKIDFAYLDDSRFLIIKNTIEMNSAFRFMFFIGNAVHSGSSNTNII